MSKWRSLEQFRTKIVKIIHLLKYMSLPLGSSWWDVFSNIGSYHKEKTTWIVFISVKQRLIAASAMLPFTCIHTNNPSSPAEHEIRVASQPHPTGPSFRFSASSRLRHFLSERCCGIQMLKYSFAKHRWRFWHHQICQGPTKSSLALPPPLITAASPDIKVYPRPRQVSKTRKMWTIEA